MNESCENKSVQTFQKRASHHLCQVIKHHVDVIIHVLSSRDFQVTGFWMNLTHFGHLKKIVLFLLLLIILIKLFQGVCVCVCTQMLSTGDLHSSEESSQDQRAKL